MQGQFAAVGGTVLAVWIEAADDGFAALVQGFAKVALHQAQPVAVDQHLVVGIDGGDRVFAVHDGGQRGLQQQVLDPGGVALADQAVAIDLDLDVQAVVLQQHCTGRLKAALIADELLLLGEGGGAAILQGHLQRAACDGVSAGIGMAAAGQRCNLVEEGAGEGDHPRAAQRVVSAASLGAMVLGDRIGTVQGVVQRAPACVRGVQRVARVHHRHHQLRAGLHGDLAVDVGGADLHLSRLRQQVADALEEGAVGGHVGDRAGVGLVPGIQLGLQAVTLGQQGAVLRREVVDQAVEAGPEGLGGDAGARQHLLLDEVPVLAGHLQAQALRTLGHVVVSCSDSSREGFKPAAPRAARRCRPWPPGRPARP
ncbi:hypothetical protein D3C78_688870 [compost metagenome]